MHHKPIMTSWISPVMEASALASGDLAAQPIVINNVARTPGGIVRLDTVHVIDGDDQGIALDLYFGTTATVLGTLNSVPDISDANILAGFAGYLAIAAASLPDVGGARVGSIQMPNGLLMQCDAGYTRLYVGVIARGTPTYTAAGLKFRFGFSRW